MWRLGFFFHEMGFGLLSIFLPLYVMSIEPVNGLFYIGILAAAALLLAIPASFFWGYICDKTRRYKRYILLSFFASAVLLYVFTYVGNVALLIILYGIIAIFQVAHEAPKNVLVAELYSRQDWEKTYAFYEGFTETGWLVGLVIGFVMSTFGLQSWILFVCSALNFVAFTLSILFVTDPLLVFERRLVGIEKTVDFATRGIFLASNMLDGAVVTERMKKENVAAFCCGLILFSLATSILFTPMPVFISNAVKDASLPAGFVFAVFVLNSSGGVLGHTFVGIRSDRSMIKGGFGKIVLLRCLFALLFVVALQLSGIFTLGLATALLMLMGFFYSMFLVQTLCLSMELVPAGKAGLFNVLVGVGGACGSFAGPWMAQSSGFLAVFIASGVLFLTSFVAFKVTA